MVRLNKKFFNQRNFKYAKKFGEDTKDIYDKYQFFQGEEPQEGLVPLGNSPFYMTPTEPASPFDCNRYPDSLYCGGNPLSGKIADLEVSLVRDNCTLGIQLQGTLGFIKLPPFQFVYRDQSCRLSEPPPEPDRNSNNFSAIPYPQKKCDNGWMLQFATDVSRKGRTNVIVWSGQLIAGQVFQDYERSVIYQLKIATTDYQGNLLIREKYKPEFYAEIEVNYTDTSIYSLYPEGVYNFYGNPPPSRMPQNKSINQKGIIKYLVTSDPRATVNGYYGDYAEEIFIEGDNPVNARTEAASGVVAFMWHLIAIATKPSYEQYTATPLYHGCSIVSRPPYSAGGYEKNCRFYRIEQICDEYQPYIDPPPPPDLNRKKKDKDKMCCNETKQMMQLILKRLGDLPATVPVQLTDHTKGEKRVNSISEFISYTVKQLDAIAGQFPVEIEIEDSDLTKEGNQKQIVKLPNIAESLAEIVGILLTLRTESDTNLNATIRGLIETGSAKQIAFQAYEYAKANAEFLAYKGRQVERKVPFVFKPGEEKLDKMLQETEVKVKGWENDDKEDIKDLLYPILELAAQWKAQNFVNLGTTSPKSNLREILSTGIDIAKLAQSTIKDANTPKDDDKAAIEKDDFEQFLEEIENGFIAQSGISNNVNPYGYPRENRPRIREIGTTKGEQ